VNYVDKNSLKRLEEKKKLRVRERIDRLLDRNSGFMELS